MSKSELSPFTPGQPVPVDLFTGRGQEVSDLDTRATAASMGRLEVAFLSGERGIGKSSIAALVKSVAEQSHSLLCVHAFMAGASTPDEVVRRLFEQLAKNSRRETWFESIQKLFGGRLKEVGVLGASLRFEPEQAELGALVSDFASAIRAILEKLEGQKVGLMLILDDINGLAGNPEFARWLKSLVDGIAVSQEPLPLFLLLVGLEDRRREMISHNPSVARLFHLVELRPWTTEETAEFFTDAFERSGVTVTSDAMTVMCLYTGGIPALAHEIGEAAFRLDQDGEISNNDALQAVRSAAEVVGRKHIQPLVLDAVRSKRYRAILQKIPTVGASFKRSELIEQLRDDEASVVDNFLNKMRKLGVLEQDVAEGSGWWRFTTRLHYVYLLSEAMRAKSEPAD